MSEEASVSMFQYLSLILLLVCSARASSTIIGDEAQKVDAKLYPYACKVHVFTESTGEVAFCSGTVIDSKHILTAAHCFKPGFKIDGDHSVSVNCANEFLPDPTHVYLPKNVDTALVSPHHKWEVPTIQDQALIEFKSNLKIVALTRATHPEIYFDANGMMLDQVSCQILGYGKSAENNFGTLHQAKIKNVSIEISASQGIRIFRTDHSNLTTSADEGDSGGTLLCQAPGHAPELVGVTNAYSSPAETSSERIANYFSPVFNSDQLF